MSSVRRGAGVAGPAASPGVASSGGTARPGGAGAGGLARYLAAATLARAADGGAVVAIVLLVTTSGGPGWLAGLLGAAITAPHLAGPFIARPLDTARDGRTVIAVACLVHGVTLAAAVLLYPYAWPLVTAVLLAASGLVGPLLTGGISSRLPAIAGPDRRSQRRAQGWDVATYGIAGTVGPSAVAAVAAWASPTVAALVLAVAVIAAAGLIRLLPYAPPAATRAQAPHPARTLGLMLSTGPLRRTLYLTMSVALSVQVLPVVAVASTGTLGVGAAAAGVLTAAYGVGGLAASMLIMLRPLPGDADRAMTILAVTVAAALTLVAVTTTFGAAVAAYAVTGVLNSYFFAATLAARSEYAPATARGQVFVWIGALKISAGSAGTALAGTLIGAGAHLPLLLAVTCTTIAAAVSLADRSAQRPRFWFQS
ncbi:MFS transporter [Actinoplanes palleronii]|uniref:MFS transporter n=1 Tax=Actinoplanes palleronii TaxID=113570 RepID=UPI001942067D|nr:MFS transporter [Actinoplanes palleronii]